MMEAWFTLMAEAAKGTNEAQEAFKLFPTTTTNPDAMQQWMSRFMGANAAASPSELNNWYDEWCRMMGVVPRARYLDLLERHEITRNRLAEAEEKIRQLQSRLGVSGQEEETKKMLDLWSNTVETTLQAQAEWMRAWGSMQEKTTDEEPPEQKKS